MIAHLLDPLGLPAQITQFEREYLGRTNRSALIVSLVHVPVFVLVAWLNDTDATSAFLLAGLGVLGPLVAMRTLDNPRHVSIVFGITAMYAGGLLVHFGRGLWTIEMHFYFFVAISLLAVFANPRVILAAAGTVTAHHALLWWVAPQSVFNYDAPMSSVLVHAAFVVFSSLGSCFVARSFFDNVIGLERVVAERTRALDAQNRSMQQMFDHVGQGLVTASLDGTLSTEHSRAISRWIGAPAPGQRIWEYFGAVDPSFGDWLEVGWEALADDILPIDLLLHQLPGRFVIGEATFEVRYSPIEEDGAVVRLLVVVTDASERIARERADLVQRETVAAFQRISSDRAGFLEFFEETTARVEALSMAGDGDGVVTARAIHTIKGNAALFGVSSVVAACNAAEIRCAEAGEPPSAEDRALVARAWDDTRARVSTFLGEIGSLGIEVEEEELVAVLRAIAADRPREEVSDRIAGWRDEPTRRRLTRFGEQARALAAQLGMGPIEVAIHDNRVRLPREGLVPFWSALVHVIRNAVDHGLMARRGGICRLELATTRSESGVVVSVSDNGPGIDWDGLRARARAQGLPSETSDDLLEALFHDGVTTRDTATETSGRGVGLASVRQACRAIGVEIAVASSPTAGTRFDFVLPTHIAMASAA